MSSTPIQTKNWPWKPKDFLAAWVVLNQRSKDMRKKYPDYDQWNKDNTRFTIIWVGYIAVAAAVALLIGIAV